MNNQKPILFFLHGFLGSPQDFFYLEKHLKESFRVISIDLLDLLQQPSSSTETSNKPEEIKYTLKYLSEKIFLFLKQHRITKAHFWGYSMGGRIFLELYRNHPEVFLSLTLESTALGILDSKLRGIRSQQDDTWVKILNEQPKEFLEKWYSQPLFQSFKASDIFKESFLQREKTFLSDFNLSIHPDHHNSLTSAPNHTQSLSLFSRLLKEASQVLNPDHYDMLQKISIPTLVLIGEEDHKYCEIWAKALPRSHLIRVRYIVGSGHVVHLEKPNEALKEFLEFIK